MTLILQYPHISPTVTITLPNPQQGDAEQRSLKTKIGVSMSGKLTTTISTGNLVRLIYSFDKLTRTLITALSAMPAGDIKLTDWNGYIWKVKLLSNPIEYTENKSFYACQLEFSGTRIS